MEKLLGLGVLPLRNPTGARPSGALGVSPPLRHPSKLGAIVSLNISEKKGQKKRPVDELTLVQGRGVAGDAHYDSPRQVSLLPEESIQKMKDVGLDVNFGSFAENITTQGLDAKEISIGQKLNIGGALVEVTEIGKDCHAPCEIYRQAGYCVMPEDGIFAKILEGGKVTVGDKIERC